MSCNIVDRQAWLLYADTNTRFNILIEECMHLRDVVFGYIGDELFSDEWDDDINSCSSSINVKPDLIIGEEEYCLFDGKDRALKNLWNYLVSLIKGLEENQKTFRSYYHEYILHQKGDSFFWLICSRDYFINKLFEQYTDNLEHAHEKLIQMLENEPNNLPQSPLLRRWQSALYGEFLGTYSRHLKWEVGALVNKLAATESHRHEATNNCMIHSWTHVPTSRLDQHKLSSEDVIGNKTNSLASFNSIKSAFFYLEMPALFPLLYHECAHMQIGYLDQSKILFKYKSRMVQIFESEAPKCITKGSRIWSDLVEEVWADMLAIALGGLSYLAALNYQLFGLTVGNFFADTLEKRDQHGFPAIEEIPITKFGTRELKIWDLAEPYPETHYFWEVRLSIALEAYKFFHEDSLQSDADAAEFVSSIEATIAEYSDSAEKAFDFSNNTRSSWDYRNNLNQWLKQEFLKDLREPFKYIKEALPVSSAFKLDQPVINGIEKAINAYKNKYFNGKYERHKISPAMRLDSISNHVKWDLSTGVVHKLNQSLTGEQNDLEVWTEKYASYIRNDGGTSFRMGLEWFLCNDSIICYVADLLRHPVVKDDADTTNHSDLHSDFDCLFGDKIRHILKNVDHTKKHRLASLLKSRTLTNSDGIRREEIKDLMQNDLKAELDNCSSLITYAILNTKCKEKVHSITNKEIDDEFQVGELSLGQFRFNEHPFDGSISDTLCVVGQYFAKRKEYLNDLKFPVRNGKICNFDESCYSPLLGEYFFMHYQHGTTPAERTPEIFGCPHVFTKTRTVLRVHGYCASPGCKKKVDSCGLKNEELCEKLCKSSSKWNFGSLSFIKYHYRWQWLVLKQKLEDEKYEGAKLFVSSGWDDAVLVLWHQSIDQFWETYNNLGLGSTRSCYHVQTQLIVPGLDATKQDSSKARGSSVKEVFKTAFSTSNVSVLERLGRFDWTITIEDNEIDNVCKGLNKISSKFWRSVSNIAFSLKRDVPEDGTAPKDVLVVEIRLDPDPYC